MNVKGPGGPPGTGDVPDVGGAEEIESGVVEATGVERSEPVQVPMPGSDPVAALAQSLKSGAIPPGEALGRLLDLVTDRVPAAVRAKVRAELEESLREHPALAERARRLGLIG